MNVGVGTGQAGGGSVRGKRRPRAVISFSVRNRVKFYPILAFDRTVFK
jgi:hypothetical protein